MAFCSGLQRRPCSPSALIPSTWALRSAFSPCSTPGAPICSITPTCIVWSPAAVFLRMALNGLPAGMGFSCPCGCSQGSFVGCSWSICSAPLKRETGVLLLTAITPRPAVIPGLLGSLARGRMGGLRKEAFRWARAGVGLRRAMEKTILCSRSTCGAQAWPNQAIGEALANASSLKESKPQISFTRLHQRSLHAPRSHKASYVLITSPKSPLPSHPSSRTAAKQYYRLLASAF